MSEEDYTRLSNLLNTVIEQQATFAENHAKAEARMSKVDERLTRNTEGIAALLVLAEVHEREITANGEQIKANGEQIRAMSVATDEKIKALAERTAETDERLNALINVVERIISKSQ